MPETAHKIAAQLNTSLRTLEDLDVYGRYISGTKVVENPEILFLK